MGVEATRVKTEPIGWTSAVVALAVCFVRGGNQVALKFGLTGFAPLWTAFLRMLVGALTVWAWGRWRGLSLVPSPEERRSLLQLSTLFVVQMGMLHFGADYTSPAYAVVLMSSNPIFANIMAHFIVAEDRLSALRVLGLALAFAGVAAVSLGKPDAAIAPDPVLGNLVILGSAVLVAIRLIYTQRLVQTIEPTRTVFAQMIFSLPFFLAGALWFGPAPEPGWPAVAGVLYQGIMISGVSFMAWATLLQRHSPASLSVFSFTVPVFGVMLSGWLFAEAITTRLMLGVLAVTGGIALATHAGRKVALARARELEGESALALRE